MCVYEVLLAVILKKSGKPIYFLVIVCLEAVMFVRILF